MTDLLHRVLVIDDNPWIHDDVRKVLAYPEEDEAIERLERELTGAAAPDERRDRDAQLRFEIDSALQGREGVEAVRRARGDGRPYAIAFVDIRMPPGWDGIETIERLWEADPDVQAVICSAYSDYSWSAIQRRIGGTDRLLVLKKPFDAIEIFQLAHTLTRKWSLQRAEHRRTEELEELLFAELARTGQLAAGLAGEIDGPIQDLSGNLQLLRASCDDRDCGSSPAATTAVLDAAFDGLGRIARLVRAAKELGRDDRGERSAVDLNGTLLATLEVVRHAYRSVADVEAELGELPRVTCVGSELNLVFLNLMVNAAHAIREDVEGTGRRGTIRVRTWIHGDEALISVASTAKEIPERLRTEQGLAIARSVIVRNGGTLTLETEPGRGATATIRFPVGGARPDGES
jgi:two-component system NtrC family sensor kinase